MFNKLKKAIYPYTNIIYIVIVGVALRVLWVLSFEVVPVSDFMTYHNLACELSQGRIGYTDYISIFPHVFGYPFILSVFYKIFGAGVFTAQILNIVFSFGIILLVFFIGKAINSQKCGLFAAFIWAVWPSQIYYNSLVCTEIIFTFLVLLFCFLFLVTLKKFDGIFGAPFLFCVLGIFLGLTNSIRPFGMIFLIAVAIYYLLLYKRGKAGRYKKMLNYIVLVLAFIITTKVINYNISDLIGRDVSQSSGYSLFVGSNYKYGGIWNIDDALVLDELTDDPDFKAANVHSALFEMAKDRIYEQKAYNMLLVFKKIKNVWSLDSEALMYIKDSIPEGSASYQHYSKLFVAFWAVANIYYYGVLIMLFIVIIKSMKYIKLYNKSVAFFVLLVLGVVGAHIFVEASTRYHFTAISFICIVLGYFLSYKEAS